MRGTELSPRTLATSQEKTYERISRVSPGSKAYFSGFESALRSRGVFLVRTKCEFEANVNHNFACCDFIWSGASRGNVELELTAKYEPATSILVRAVLYKKNCTDVFCTVRYTCLHPKWKPSVHRLQATERLDGRLDLIGTAGQETFIFPFISQHENMSSTSRRSRVATSSLPLQLSFRVQRTSLVRTADGPRAFEQPY